MQEARVSRLGEVYETQHQLARGKRLACKRQEARDKRQKQVGWVETFHGTSLPETQHQLELGIYIG